MAQDIIIALLSAALILAGRFSMADKAFYLNNEFKEEYDYR
ncbi:hypothetical protein [Agathobaculum desmolans]|nr:hypothetical protein [Agathobaculum desmolans]